MKDMKKFLFLVSFAVLFASCENQVEVIQSLPDFENPDLYASLPDETRTFLSDSNAIHWNLGDAVTVFAQSDHNLKYQIAEIASSGTYARFSYTGEFVTHSGTLFARYIAVFPYLETTTVASNVVSMDIPSYQDYDATNDFKHIPMTGAAFSMDVNFSAPSSVVRVRVSRDPEDNNPNNFTLKKIILSSKNNYIAGRVNINVKETVHKAILDPSQGVPSNSIMVDLGDGILLTNEQQSIFAAVPAMTVEGGDFSITCVYDINGTEYKTVKEFADPIDFKAGVIKATSVKIATPDLSGSTDGNGGEFTGDLVIDDENFMLDEPLIVPSGGTASITLEGQTICNSEANANSALIVIQEGAELTISGDGVISSASATTEPQAAALSATRSDNMNTAFPIVVNGTLIIEGGDFTLNSYASSWLNCGIYVAPGGKLVVKGGSFRSTNGSYLFGRDDFFKAIISIIGGRFHNYNPGNNGFEGDGTDYVDDPDYASYRLDATTYEVLPRTSSFDVDNAYLLKSIFENGGTANIIAEDNLYLSESTNVRYPVTVNRYVDPYAMSIIEIQYFGNDTAMLHAFEDITLNFYDSESGDYTYQGTHFVATNEIIRSYEGATVAINGGDYYSYNTTAITSNGGDIVVNEGYFEAQNDMSVAIKSIDADGNEVYTMEDHYVVFDNIPIKGIQLAEASSGTVVDTYGNITINNAWIYGQNPSAAYTSNGEVKNYVPSTSKWYSSDEDYFVELN